MKRTLIDKIAKTKKDNNEPLLSNFSGDFWQEYLDNFAAYDNYFARKFSSFYYWLPVPESDAVTDFVDDVNSWLTIHAKDLSELYRIHVIDDSNYSLTNNYDMREHMEKDITSGARTDNRSTTEGSRTDNETSTQGQQSNSTTNIYGTETTTDTQQVSPYDAETWNNQQKNTTENSRQNDSMTENLGQRQDTKQATKGQQSNTEQATKGQQQDTEEYTLTRVGNIGTMTATDLLEKHANFWKKTDFYNYIFDNLAKEFLMASDPDNAEDWILCSWY